ncbi:T9SS type A sorting domain-containing protein, partial [Bacteroidales bacterium OttesenSCG-928-C19]|nr:T9SS type A sorting domain-containing protein [Bacteroidales bacterium OttesenSCG-928-C19]
TVCYGGSTTLAAETTVEGAEFRWYATNDPSSTVLSTESTLEVEDLTSGTTYYVSVQNDTLCENVAGELKAVYVGVREEVTVTMSDDETICYGATADITLNLTGTAPWTITYSTDGGTTMEEIMNIMTTPYVWSVQPTETTTYKLMSVIDAFCSNDVDASTTISTDPHAMSVTIDGDKDICYGSSAEVILSFTGTATAPWKVVLNDGTRDITIDTIMRNPYTFKVSPEETTTYTLKYVKDQFCENDELEGELTVNVHALPSLSVPDTLTYCHGEQTPEYSFVDETEGFVYFWEREVGQNFGLSETEGINVIPSFKAENTGAYPLFGVYKARVQNEEGLRCSSAEKKFVIVVNPVPEISPNDIRNRVYCNQSVIGEFTFSGTVVGTNYIWEKESGTDIQGIPFEGMDVIPGFTAVNVTNAPITANYKVTADFTYAGRTCNNGDTARFNISIVPNPDVEVSPAHQTICSGSSIDAVVFESSIDGTDFRWERTSEYVPGLPSSGIGNMEKQELINNGSTAHRVLYQVTPMYTMNGVTCEGISKTFSITVNPNPFVYSIPDMNYCTGERVASYSFGDVAGARYTWEKVEGDNVGLPENGNGPLPSFVAVNDGNGTLTAQYRVTAEYIYENTVCEKDTVFNVTVNAYPSTATVEHYVYCANDTVPELDFRTLFANDNVEGTIYRWKYESGSPNIGLSQVSGVNVMPSFVATNTSQDIISAVYSVRAVNGNCEGESSQFTITIAQDARITKHPESQLRLCDGISEISLSVEATGDNLKYQWYFNGTALAGETSSTYTALYTADMAGFYHAEITTACGNLLISNEAEIGTNTIVVERKWDDVLFIRDREGDYASYQWYKDGKAISVDGKSQYYTDVNGFDGSYSVKAYYADGVTFDETCPLTITKTKGYKISMYPNPAVKDQNVKLLIESDSAEDYSGNVEVFDVAGRTVYSGKVSDKVTELPVKLHSGAYVVRVVSLSGKVTVEKLIVK